MELGGAGFRAAHRRAAVCFVSGVVTAFTCYGKIVSQTMMASNNEALNNLISLQQKLL
jgi:hypothetical protein